MTVVTSHVLDAARRSHVSVVHLDTSDHRPVEHVGAFDIRNVALAIWHEMALIWKVIRFRPTAAYLPIAQETLGFLRDALFMSTLSFVRVPYVIHFHGAEFREFFAQTNVWVRWLARRSIGSALEIYVLTESLRNTFEGLVPSEKVTVVRNGVAPPPKIANASGRVQSPLILFISNLFPRKGFEDLLLAADLIRSRIPGARIIVAGDGISIDARRTLLDQIDARGLTKFVRLTRGISGLRRNQLLSAADVFVFPPRRPEGQGLVVLEAMSAGIPVVATRQGGLADTIHDGVDGIFANSNDPRDLADKICALLADRDRHSRIAKAGQSRQLGRFSLREFREEIGTRFASLAANGAEHARRGSP